MRIRALALLTTAVLGLGLAGLGLAGPAAGPADASTGGTADGEQHPDVALLAFYADGVRARCSGTLISPTVVLTAAHCTDGVDGKVWLTFESVIAEERPAQAPLPVAADPASGYTGTETADGWVTGDPHSHPAYSGFTDLDTWNDVGVVVLDRQQAGITPAGLAPVGTLDQISQPALTTTLFTAVGYGSEVRKADDGRGKPVPMSYPLIRRFVDMPGHKVTPQILQTNSNPHDPRGTGGTCFGDSGGPVLLDGAIIGVVSYGLNGQCTGLSGTQRTDITVVRDWLGGFLS